MFKSIFKSYKELLEFICNREACSIEELIMSYLNLNLAGLRDLSKLFLKDKRCWIKEIEKTDFIKYTISMNLHIDSNGSLKDNDSTGLFRVCFTNNNWIYFLKFYNAKKDKIKTLGISNENGWKDMETLLNEKYISFQLPGKGIFKGVVSDFSFGSELTYYELKKDNLPKHQVFHQVYDEVFNDIKIFFESDGNIYKRYNKPKMRKILLTGEPGSGKTSINLKLGRELCKSHSFVFVNDFNSLVLHLKNIEMYDMPTIIIFEDCEYALEEPNSYTLNFLDGLHQPFVQQGAYVIFTTNHPEIIEDRIIKRPGRIDKIFNVGALNDKFAFDCAKYYFNGLLNIDDSCTNIFQNLTGAQIAEISKGSVVMAISNSKEIDIEIVKVVKAELLKQLFEVEHMAERKSYKKRKSIGFRDDVPF